MYEKEFMRMVLRELVGCMDSSETLYRHLSRMVGHFVLKHGDSEVLELWFLASRVFSYFYSQQFRDSDPELQELEYRVRRLLG